MGKNAEAGLAQTRHRAVNWPRFQIEPLPIRWLVIGAAIEEHLFGTDQSPAAGGANKQHNAQFFSPFPDGARKTGQLDHS